METAPADSQDKRHLILYFQLHQPCRLNAVSLFDFRRDASYFNESLNASIIQRIARDCYLPANALLLESIRTYPGIKIAFSLSGTVIEQLEAFAPEVLDSFRLLAQTGCVEFLGETYYHSLASLVNTGEFEEQVLMHMAKMHELFSVRPTVFRNTELIYNDAIGKRVAMMGFRGIFTEGCEKMLGTRSPHRLYCHPEEKHLKIFLRNSRLSDDVAFRFMYDGRPLEAHRYMEWLESMPKDEKLVNVAFGYETFGEHQRAHTGIFNFLRELLSLLAQSKSYSMVLPSQALTLVEENTALSAESYVSWGDLERDLSAWLGNEMQKDAFNSIMKLEKDVKDMRNEALLKYWRQLQTSDHFYYMSLKCDSHAGVHSYVSPFPSSYEAFINYMNVLTHLTLRLRGEKDQLPNVDNNPARQEAERQSVKCSTPVWVMNLESVAHHNIPDLP